MSMIFLSDEVYSALNRFYAIRKHVGAHTAYTGIIHKLRHKKVLNQHSQKVLEISEYPSLIFKKKIIPKPIPRHPWLIKPNKFIGGKVDLPNNLPKEIQEHINTYIEKYANQVVKINSAIALFHSMQNKAYFREFIIALEQGTLTEDRRFKLIHNHSAVADINKRLALRALGVDPDELS